MLETTLHMIVSVTKTNGGNLEILTTHSPSCLCLQAFKMFLKNIVLGWFSGRQNILILLRTQVKSTVPTAGSTQSPPTSAPGNLTSASGLCWQLNSCADTHICTHMRAHMCTHTHAHLHTTANIFKNLKMHFLLLLLQCQGPNREPQTRQTSVLPLSDSPSSGFTIFCHWRHTRSSFHSD